MTASTTDQERAEFEAWAVAEVFPISRCFNDDSLYEYTVTQRKWEDWQAARRAPAAPQAAPISDELPQGFISDVLTAAGLVRHGKQCKALADRLGDAIEKIWTTSIAQRKAIAAAPQPPEADMGIPISAAAPVQLPEPPFWYCESKTPDAIWPIGRTTKKRESAFKDGHFNQQALYTEQQVRRLLAAHGIEVAP